MAIQWAKLCRDYAKEHKRPLIAIAIDGRHIPKGEPGHGGKMELTSNCTPEFAEKVTKLFIEACKDA